MYPDAASSPDDMGCSRPAAASAINALLMLPLFQVQASPEDVGVVVPSDTLLSSPAETMVTSLPLLADMPEQGDIVEGVLFFVISRFNSAGEQARGPLKAGDNPGRPRTLATEDLHGVGSNLIFLFKRGSMSLRVCTRLRFFLSLTFDSMYCMVDSADRCRSGAASESMKWTDAIDWARRNCTARGCPGGKLARRRSTVLPAVMADLQTDANNATGLLAMFIL